MNINIFFTVISSILFSILFFLKPLEYQKTSHKEIALFNISTFTIYEFDKNGLVTILNGENGTRYNDRYEIKDVDFTDNSQKFIANMQANNGVYKNEIINLDGNVIYIREDGINFKSQKAVYNTNTSIVKVDKKFTINKNKNIITGKSLVYNNKLNTTKFYNARATYQIKEGIKWKRL